MNNLGNKRDGIQGFVIYSSLASNFRSPKGANFQ